MAISESGTPRIANVFYVYLAAAKDEIVVSYGGFDDLAQGTGSNVYLESRYTPSSDYLFDHYAPRIACPNDPSLMDDWSVVWEMLEWYPNSSDVLGITHHGSTTYPTGADYYNYTDGLNAFPGWTAKIDKEMYPVVAYNNQNRNASGNSIQISWWGDVEAQSDPRLVSLSLDVMGDPEIVFCFDDVSNDGSDENNVKPSLAGRHGDAMNLAFVDRYWDPGVWHKDFTWAGSVRNSGPQKDQIKTPIKKLGRFTNLADNILVYPNPVKDNLKIDINNFTSQSKYSYMLIDQAGKVIRTGKIHSKNQIISLQNLPNGLYFIKFMENENNLSCVKKLLKM